MSTLPAPRPARLRDIPRAAWILSRAFASTSYLGGHIHAQALSKFGKRRAIEGDLVSGHQRVGEQTSTPHPSRNPVAYCEDAAIPQS